MSYALLALYRQQVNSGFVLGDPINPQGKIEKIFPDPATGVTFKLQWNPERELRRDRTLLVQRGIVADNIDQSTLINHDERGTACFLCEHNIKLQFPREILFEMELAGETFFAGANFAYIANNHFTIMNARHQDPTTESPSQKYREKIPALMNDFLDETSGHFRIIFNGLAGASILDHEHFQAVTERFPIEDIRIGEGDYIHRAEDITIACPFYYIPTFVIEGKVRASVEAAVNIIASEWQDMDSHMHTVNIIAAQRGHLYRIFVVLRDKGKLAAGWAGKKGAMAAFEAGGNLVLSYEPHEKRGDIDEKRTFESSDLEIIKRLLKAVSPERALYASLLDSVSSGGFGNAC